MRFDIRKVIGLLLIVGGILAVVVGGFTYTEDTHSADIGPIEFSIEEKETVHIPLWAGAAGIVIGIIVLAVGRR